MHKYKTDNLEMRIKIFRDIGGAKRMFFFGMTDKDEPLENPQICFYLPANLTKQNFTDTKFVKHLLNFFIKD